MDEPRILTDAETETRRREQASSTGPPTIAMCAHSGCPRAAHWGPHCDDHRHFTPRVGVAQDLTDADLAAVRAEVEAKAAPLFLLAMDWILRQQLAHLGIELAPVAITRDEPA